jgi:hypothetical protein
MVKYSKNKRSQNKRRKHKGGQYNESVSQAAQGQVSLSPPRNYQQQQYPGTPRSGQAANLASVTPVSAYRPQKSRQGQATEQISPAPATKPTSPLGELTNVATNLFNTGPVQGLVGQAKGVVGQAQEAAQDAVGQVQEKAEEGKGIINNLFKTFTQEASSDSAPLQPQPQSRALYGGSNRKRRNNRRKTKKNKKGGKKRNNRKSRKH